MTHDPDDLLPDQRGVLPSAEELARREMRPRRRLGRWSRLHSWATIVLGLLALAACYVLFSRTG